jgi:hypothetical protein
MTFSAKLRDVSFARVYSWRCVPVTGIGHGEGGRASTVLSLDDLVTTELYTWKKVS